MQRRATWKVVTAGAALTGLGLVGVGVGGGLAQADAPGATLTQSTGVTASVDWVPTAFDASFDDSVDSPDASVHAMDDSWDDSY